MGPCGNKKERVPAGAHSQNLPSSSLTRSYENSYQPHIGETTRRRKNKRRAGGLIFAAAALVVAAGAAAAQAGGLFAGLDGAWSGDGVAHFSDGGTSPLKCRAAYAVGGGGDHLDQSIDCASPRQSFSFRIALDLTGGEILGSWRELTRQVEGGVSGQGGPGRLQLVARGQGFTAQATVVTKGGRQTLAIASNAVTASITLRRAR